MNHDYICISGPALVFPLPSQWRHSVLGTPPGQRRRRHVAEAHDAAVVAARVLRRRVRRPRDLSNAITFISVMQSNKYLESNHPPNPKLLQQVISLSYLGQIDVADSQHYSLFTYYLTKHPFLVGSAARTVCKWFVNDASNTSEALSLACSSLQTRRNSCPASCENLRNIHVGERDGSERKIRRLRSCVRSAAL